jgi:hypothetical protein
MLDSIKCTMQPWKKLSNYRFKAGGCASGFYCFAERELSKHRPDGISNCGISPEHLADATLIISCTSVSIFAEIYTWLISLRWEMRSLHTGDKFHVVQSLSENPLLVLRQAVAPRRKRSWCAALLVLCAFLFKTHGWCAPRARHGLYICDAN